MICKLIQLSQASYEVRVPRAGGLPQASFRSRFTADTLAIWLTTTATFVVRDFHPIVNAHAGHTDHHGLFGLVMTCGNKMRYQAFFIRLETRVVRNDVPIASAVYNSFLIM
ncbi:hypothetical protein ACFLQZ_03670 [Acidobacteriota bacterium]